MMELNQYAKGLLLVFVAIICNFLGSTMNCRFQHLIQTEPLVKWLIVFGVIYFTINFTSTSNPLWLAFQSVLVFIVFILMMKQTWYTFFTLLFILMIVFVLQQCVSYFQSINPTKYEKSIKRLKTTMLVFNILLGSVLVAGNLFYLYQQYTERGSDNFSLIQFYLGTNECESTLPKGYVQGKQKVVMKQKVVEQQQQKKNGKNGKNEKVQKQQQKVQVQKQQQVKQKQQNKL